MRGVFEGLVAAFAVSGALAQVAPPDVQARIADCAPDNFSWLACAQGIERQALPAAPEVVRSPGLLTIETAARTVRLVDEHEGAYPTLVHSYLGRVGPDRHHVVLRIHHESSVHLLVHARSGSIAQMPAYPVVAPDGRHVIAASENLLAGFGPNVVEVWSVASGGFQRDAVFEPTWGPRDARWLGPHMAEVHKTCLKPNANDPAATAPCGRARIEQDRKRWRMSE